jgi:hypothetical protein
MVADLFRKELVLRQLSPFRKRNYAVDKPCPITREVVGNRGKRRDTKLKIAIVQRAALGLTCLHSTAIP